MKSQPNFVILVADDLRPDSLGAYGNRIAITPEIDRLAAAGTRFNSNFCTTAICMASRASLFTGLYTRCHGVLDFQRNHTPQSWARSYPVLLRAAGYRTGFVGKFGVGNKLPAADFDFFRGYPGQGTYFPRPDGRHLTAIEADDAIDFVASSQRTQPFCLSVSFKAPHVEDGAPTREAKYPPDPALADLYQDTVIPLPAGYHQPVPDFLKPTLNHTREGPDFAPDLFQTTMKNLYRLVTGIDRAVGRIRAALAQHGHAENTIIILTSDHGSLYGEHGLGGKWIMYEESIRTPLIIFDPRRPGPRTVSHMTLNIDLQPTVLQLAGLTVPASTQGQSVVPLLRDQAGRWRTDWFYEHHYNPPQHPIARNEGVRTERFKYVRYLDHNIEHLFDLRHDPAELTNLAASADHQKILGELRLRWAGYQESLAVHQQMHAMHVQ